MRRVINISLNGRAFQLEEDACELLSQYLDGAGQALADDPDRAEIIADLEQAIADKCTPFLGSHKNVLIRGEIEQVLAEMGPVEGGARAQATGAGATAGSGAGDRAGEAGARSSASGDPSTSGKDGAGHAPRRLYQISEGAVISGVCNGIAAYLDIDVTLVRVIAVALAFASAGLALLVYAVLMFVVPYAQTSEEHAAAHGLPFNARELVERAKRKYREFAGDDKEREQAKAEGAAHNWRRGWRQARAEMRAARRQMRSRWSARQARPVPGAAPRGLSPPIEYTVHVITRLAMALAGLVTAALVVAWLLGFMSYVTTGAFFGYVLPFNVPNWMIIIGLFALLGLFTSPMRASRYASGCATPPHAGGCLVALEGLMGAVVIAVLVVFATHHSEWIRQMLEQLREWLLNVLGKPPTGTPT